MREYKQDIANVNIGGDYGEVNSSKIAIPKSIETRDEATLASKLNNGKTTNSLINRMHYIKLVDDFPHQDEGYKNFKSITPKTFSDLCMLNSRANSYDVDDFLYCKNVGYPINRMITLRRFPYPCTDNLYDKETQGEPDVARMVTFFDQETNKMEDLLSFNYKMKWKELTATFEENKMQGAETGLSGAMLKIARFIDPDLWKQELQGSTSLGLDPTYDQNKVYGPVDSVGNTHIRDVGFEFNKEFDITFEYELRSINGRTPEYAMKDVIANVLACTYNDGKFWPGARYWVGKRPSKYYNKYQYLNSSDMDTILGGTANTIKEAISSFFEKPGNIFKTVENAIKGGTAIGLGKLLDKLGRPGILTSNSLLSGEPTGYWHLTIGNPLNPIMCIGNLILDDTEISFPTDSLSYADFPTKLRIKCKLKPAQAKDRAASEMMFNYGKQRIYYAPKEVEINKNSKNLKSTERSFFDYSMSEIDNMLGESYAFIKDGVKSISKTIQSNNLNNTNTSGDTNKTPTSDNASLLF